jgi:uncharacterized protein YebE (UPF0316 family)
MTVILSIIALQITYVSMLSIRFILMVKGVRYVASMMSAVEIGIYVIGFKLVLDNLDNPINLIIYCLSYGAGVLLGIKIEERLAIGYITVQITTKEEFGHLADHLRARGYGVTRWPGEGREAADGCTTSCFRASSSRTCTGKRSRSTRTVLSSAMNRSFFTGAS